MKTNLIVGDIEIFYKDLPKKSFDKGVALSSALRGGNWRLPTLKELGYLYKLHKLGVLNFDPDGIYWSTRKTEENMYAVINFGTGGFSSKNKHFDLNIRPVRDI